MIHLNNILIKVNALNMMKKQFAKIKIYIKFIKPIMNP